MTTEPHDLRNTRIEPEEMQGIALQTALIVVLALLVFLLV